MLKKIPFLFFFLFLSSGAFAQSSKKEAIAAIKQLKEGALFIRLKTSQNLINAYTGQGKTEAAEKVRAEQAAENLEIMRAFARNFDFCPVYFFYSDNSEKIRQGIYKGSLFYALDNPADFSGQGTYLIGEFGESENGKIEGFIFKDKDSKPLRSPFPFMVRLNKGGVMERSKAEIAALASKELHSFYNEVTTKSKNK